MIEVSQTNGNKIPIKLKVQIKQKIPIKIKPNAKTPIEAKDPSKCQSYTKKKSQCKNVPLKSGCYCAKHKDHPIIERPIGSGRQKNGERAQKDEDEMLKRLDKGGDLHQRLMEMIQTID